MKETNLTRQRSADIQRGLTDPSAARSLSWIEEMTVDGDVLEGNVVVVQDDGTVTYTTTVGDGRPTGVCLDDADDGETVQVVFGGPVPLVNLVASGTAGDSIGTSATPGLAQVSTDDAFAYLTSSGTTPSAFLWGGRGGGIGGGGGDTGADDFEPVFDHGNMGATETIDLADGTAHRGTLDDDCDITVTGFTIDELLVVYCEFSQDGSGNHGITWDPDVQFIGDDQPDQTAGSVTVFLLFSSAGDSTIYGAKVGGSSVAALDDLTDVTITAPAEDDQLQYVGGLWVNNSRRWEPVTTNPGTGPEIVFTGDDIVMTWRTY